jgi:DNA ligase-1
MDAKYIIRWLGKSLGTGAAEKTILGALARAFAYSPPNKKSNNQKKALGEPAFFELVGQLEFAIKEATCEFPNFGLIIERLLEVGDQHELIKETCHMRVGIPLKPMLAKPTKGVQIILKRFENIRFTCEYKYDGFRG